jgi:AbrB family looped-hinge helix DNA binding protein
MKTTIDRAGRRVIPKPLRDRVGLRPGVVEVTVDGTGLRVEPIAESHLDKHRGRLVIASSGQVITDDGVRTLRDADENRRAMG